MGIAERLKPLVLGRRSEEKTLYECRHCGVGVHYFDEQCPNCTSTSIARYEF